MAVSQTPWGDSLVLTTAHTRYKLITLLNNLASNRLPLISVPGALINACQGLVIQSDGGNGGANLYIGNENVDDGSGLVDATAAKHCMSHIVAFMAFPVPVSESNLVHLDCIYLMSDLDNTVINLCITVR